MFCKFWPIVLQPDDYCWTLWLWKMTKGFMRHVKGLKALCCVPTPGLPRTYKHTQSLMEPFSYPCQGESQLNTNLSWKMILQTNSTHNKKRKKRVALYRNWCFLVTITCWSKSVYVSYSGCPCGTEPVKPVHIGPQRGRIKLQWHVRAEERDTEIYSRKILIRKQWNVRLSLTTQRFML